MIRHDIYAYRPQDLAKLRDDLLKLKRAQDRKRRKRERLYKLDGEMDVDVVYDSDDLIVRHIKNKQASCHYGLGTKWCISMRGADYFEDYETHNATFFFFERKVPVGDEYDKMALMVPRKGPDGHLVESIQAFTSLDEEVDVMVLARVHGPRVFDIFRAVYERSEQYPGSAMFQVYAGIANQADLEAVWASIGKLNQYEVESAIEAICCNEATTWPMLEEIARRAPALSLAAARKQKRRRGLRRRRNMSQARLRRLKKQVAELAQTVSAAIAIHPNTPADVREKVVKELRRKHIKLVDIRLTNYGGLVGIVYKDRGVHGRRASYRRRYRRRFTLSALRRRIRMFVNGAKRARKMLKTAERKKKLADAKKLKKAKAAEKKKAK